MTTFFFFLIFGSLLSSLYTITSINPVISVTFLILTFVFSAIFLIFKGIIFIGLSYIIIYVGAIAVIFLFVVMMINIRLNDFLETELDFSKSVPLAILFGYIYLLIGTSFLESNLFSFYTEFGFNLKNILNSYYLRLFDRGFNFDLLNNNKSERVFNEGNIDLNQLSLSESLSSGFWESKFIEVPQLQTLGLTLYSYSGVLLIVLGFVLLLGMFSAILIANNKD